MTINNITSSTATSLPLNSITNTQILTSTPYTNIVSVPGTIYNTSIYNPTSEYSICIEDKESLERKVKIANILK